MTGMKVQPVPVDVKTVPWSCRGSYMSCSTLSGDLGVLTPNIDVALVSHYKPYGVPCFVFRPETTPLPPPKGFHTTPSPAEFRATPEKLEWVVDGATVASATWQSDRILRLHGTVPFSLDTDQSKLRSYLYTCPKPHSDAVDFVDWSSIGLMPLRIIAGRGSLTTINSANYEDGRVTIHPENGEWEMFIHERTTSDPASDETADDWVQKAMQTPFDKCVAETARTFAQYARDLCPWGANPVDLHATYIMWTSTARAEGFMTRETVLMSKLWMNKVWSWDNCFNALALAPNLLQSAVDNLMEPFRHQLSDGRIPDAIMYNEFTWDFTKPPIQGWTLERLLALHPDISKEVLEDMYDPLHRFTNFWVIHRRCAVSELPYYSHGNDSGWDNSTSFDGERVVVNADLAAHLILQSDVLAKLSKRLGKGHEAYWEGQRDRMIKALMDELWDGEQFRVKSAITGKTRRSTSLLQLVPLTAARFLPKDVVEKLIARVDIHMTPWGLASEPVTSPLYESDGYWRGPIWAPSTIIIESGIREAGHTKLADDIRSRFFALCKNGGFAENFDAVTGGGHRDLSHTWTSSIYLVLRGQEHN